MIHSLVHVISARDVFGPEKTTINECRALMERGSKCAVVNIIPPDRGNAMQRKVEAAGIPYFRVGGSGRIDLVLIRDLRRIVDRAEAEIVHSHGFKSDVYCYVALRSRSVPLVTTIHGWTSENLKVRMYERVQALVWRRYDRVFAVSKAYRETALRRGVPASRLMLLYNGIIVPDDREPASTELRSQQRARWGFDESHIVVGSVGRLSAEKNHAFLLAVAATLRDRGSRCRFVVVGEGVMRPGIERQIRALKLDGQIVLTGHVDATAAIYAGIDVLAIHSLREGLPNVLLEAMLQGIPVVSVPVGGVPEVMDQQVGGIVTSGWQVEEYAAALEQLAVDENRRIRLGAEGRDRVVARFSFRRRMDAITAQYEQLMA